MKRCPVISQVEILIGYNGDISPVFEPNDMNLQKEENGKYFVQLAKSTNIIIHKCLAEEFGSKLFRFTGTDEFVQGFADAHQGLEFRGLRSEEEIFERANAAFVAPELRESARANAVPGLIQQSDLVGVLHVHTTYSDGLHSLKDMCERARDLGYDYIGITDHSQAAFYANGLKPDRLRQQWGKDRH
ncbi:MAG: PHP domain-containing protein [Saprospiraceae bacterium]